MFHFCQAERSRSLTDRTLNFIAIFKQNIKKT